MICDHYYYSFLVRDCNHAKSFPNSTQRKQKSCTCHEPALLFTLHKTKLMVNPSVLLCSLYFKQTLFISSFSKGLSGQEHNPTHLWLLRQRIHFLFVPIHWLLMTCWACLIKMSPNVDRVFAWIYSLVAAAVVFGSTKVPYGFTLLAD